MDEPHRLAVLISGTGKTLKNLIDRIKDGALNAEIRLVIASTPKAPGLKFAKDAGIQTKIVRLVTRPLLPSQASEQDSNAPPQVVCDSIASFSREVFKHCKAARVRLVVLGGFLKLLQVPSSFQNRVINIHPSILPLFGGKGFYGIRVHQEVLKYGMRVTGCTVHYVDNEYDHGRIIDQKIVPVLPDDTPEKLSDRVFLKECELYPKVIESLLTGRDDKKVRLQKRMKKTRSIVSRRDSKTSNATVQDAAPAIAQNGCDIVR